MSSSLEKIDLIKPSEDDFYNINIFNSNSTKIENALSDIYTAYGQLGGDMERKIAEDSLLFYGMSNDIDITIPELFYAYGYMGSHSSHLESKVEFRYFPINFDFKLFSFSNLYPDSTIGMNGSVKVLWETNRTNTIVKRCDVYSQSGNQLTKIEILINQFHFSTCHISSSIVSSDNSDINGIGITRVYLDVQDIYQRKHIANQEG